jgi:hypothetical protein
MWIPNPFTLIIGFVVFTASAVIVIGIAYVLLKDDDLGPADACQDAVTGEQRDIQRDVAYAETFQQTWDSINAQLAAGATEVTLGFSESEVTSRAAAYLDERDAPLDDLTICFHDGYAEARASVEVPGASDLPLVGGAFDTTARITGTLDLTGEHPQLVVTDFDAGNLPGIVEDELRDSVEDSVNDRLTGLTLRYDYTSLVFTEGTATITATAVVP